MEDVTSPAVTVGALGAGVVAAAYVIGSAAVGGYLAEEFVSERDSAPDSTEEPVEQLKRRYVDGDIDETEFERRLDMLVAADRTYEARDPAADEDLSSTKEITRER